ncbi:MAG TPA: NAD(P)H-hydrate epimerase, partial [Rhodothermales bacterium]
MNPDERPDDVDRWVELAEPVLSAAAMRSADAYTSKEFGLPMFTLMETAGRSAVAAAIARYGGFRGRRVAVLCGKGNNGGDGLVMARVFLNEGASVVVLLPDSRDGMSEDAARNLRILESLAEHLPPERLSFVTREALDSEPLAAADLYVDALLGTGLSQSLREPTLSLVAWLNERRAPVLAVDVPTGLDSDTGEIRGNAVRADLTVTMGALKPGLLLNQGPACAGRMVVSEIGIPRHALLRGATQRGSGLRTTDALVRAVLPSRDTSSHKYSVGLALVVGGSPGLT